MKKGILLLGLFMSVFNFNSLFGQCNNCPFVVGVDEYSITYAGQITGGDLSLTGDICINGLFIVEDVNVEFISSTVHLGKNAKIIVSPLLTLKISNSTLQSCDQINMWDKIEVKVGGTLKIDNSTVADAKLAIDFSGHIWNGQVGGVVLQKVTFNKNWISIYFHDFWNFGTSISRLDEVTIQSLTTTGQPTTSLLAPYNLYQRSSVGIWAAQSQVLFPGTISAQFAFKMINIETGIKAFGKTYLYKSIFDNCGFGIIVNGYIQRIENNTFLNCRTCISGSGGGVNIEKNIFTNFTNYAIQYNLKGIRSVINSNQFNCNGILPMPFNSTKTAKAAIFLYSYFYSNPPLSAPNNLMISDNYITNCKDGIVLNNLKANSVNSINNVILPAIWSNFIWLQTPFVNLGITTNSAIKVLNCRNIGTAQNSISRGSTNETRNGLELQSIRGISYEFSTQTIWVNRNNTRYIWKNFLENINNSVIFKGSCLGVGVQCNTFFDPYYGVTIGGANEIADISNQLPYPLTYPNLTATINAWNDNGNSNQQFRVFGNNAQMVYWNHQGYIGGPYYPDVTNCTNVQPNFTGLLFPDPCVEDIHQDPPPSFELRESVIGSIVRGDLQYNFDNGVLFERSAREFAYEALKAN